MDDCLTDTDVRVTCCFRGTAPPTVPHKAIDFSVASIAPTTLVLLVGFCPRTLVPVSSVAFDCVIRSANDGQNIFGARWTQVIFSKTAMCLMCKLRHEIETSQGQRENLRENPRENPRGKALLETHQGWMRLRSPAAPSRTPAT